MAPPTRQLARKQIEVAVVRRSPDPVTALICRVRPIHGTPSPVVRGVILGPEIAGFMLRPMLVAGKINPASVLALVVFDGPYALVLAGAYLGRHRVA